VRVGGELQKPDRGEVRDEGAVEARAAEAALVESISQDVRFTASNLMSARAAHKLQ